MTSVVPRSIPRVRLTRRGIGIMAGGVVIAAAALTFGIADLVALGVAAILLVVASAGWMSAMRLDRGRSALTVVRQIAPNPVVRDRQATIALFVRAERPTARVGMRLAGLRLGEQAARELCDSATLRAKITTAADHISIRYALVPHTRGRWTLGPLLASSLDVFGLARTDQELGGADQIAVWPKTVDLQIEARGIFGDHERTGSGARLASTDDTTLRDYVSGDDPRRVHWQSAARRGQLMVRADESGGLPPVTVLLDRGLLPRPDTPSHGDWAVECAASIAVSVARVGHPARILATRSEPAASPSFVLGRGQESSVELLNATLDLWGHPNPQDAHRATAATLNSLAHDRVPGGITVAILGPLADPALTAAAAFTIDKTAWAIVVDDRAGSPSGAAATADFLRRHGWRAVVCGPSTTIDDAWLLVTGAAS